MSALVALAVPLLLGALALRLGALRVSAPLAAQCAWAWLLGSLVWAALLFAWTWLGAPLGLAHLLGLAAAAALALALAARMRGAHPAQTGPAGHSGPAASPTEASGRAARIPLALATLLVALAAWRAQAEPVWLGDEAHIWGWRAQRILLEGGLRPVLRGAGEDPSEYVRHVDYPLLDPLLQLWSLRCAGAEPGALAQPALASFAGRWPMQASALALGWLLACELAAVAGAWGACALLLALFGPTASAQIAGSGAADLLVGFGLCAAAAAWLRWQHGGQRAWGTRAALALAFALSAKNEALLYAAALLGARVLWIWFGGLRRERWRPWLAPALALGLHLGLRAFYGLWSDMAGGNPRGSLWSLALEQARTHAGPAAAELARLWFDPRALGGLGCLLVAVLALDARRALAGPRGLLLLALGAAALGQWIVYVGTPYDLEWHLQTSAPRVLWQLAPLAALCAAPSLARRAGSRAKLRTRPASS